MSAARYAIYLAPREPAAFWRFGSSLIGYDAESGQAVAQTVPSGFAADEWARSTAEPRRYGFHATIKAPFRLAAGRTQVALTEALHLFCSGREGFEMQLRPSLLGGFVALTPERQSVDVSALEQAAVEAFEPFRAPLTPEEMQRRLASKLSERQKALLDRYGYPFVLEEFQLHLTLSGNLPRERRDAALTAIGEAYAREFAGQAIRVDSLVLFKQDEASAPFRIIERAPFRASSP